MKKFYLIMIVAFFAFTAQGQYYYNPPAITPYGNPGNLNNNAENPYGNGLPGGWTVIQPATHPAWSALQTLPFTFTFNGQVSHKLEHPLQVWLLLPPTRVLRQVITIPFQTPQFQTIPSVCGDLAIPDPTKTIKY